MDLREQLAQGRASLARVGEVRPGSTADLPYVVTDGAGEPVGFVSAFLRDLMLGDCRPATCRSYANDLLRWFRLLATVGTGWEHATRGEVALLVAWMRNAPNPQRRRRDPRLCATVNLKTGKPYLAAGYARATINHALTVVRGFYAFHIHNGAGPLVNPVPEGSQRRVLLAHRSPLEPVPPVRRAALRQKIQVRQPRSIPDAMWAELFAAMRCTRDRALLACYVSSGARASELLGLRAETSPPGRRYWRMLSWEISSSSSMRMPLSRRVSMTAQFQKARSSCRSMCVTVPVLVSRSRTCARPWSRSRRASAGLNTRIQVRPRAVKGWPGVAAWPAWRSPA